MKQELIINGQHVDMRADTDITLEWVSGLFEDIGSIKLSHSYSIKLPKTLKNLCIFDDPGNPAHQSTQTRRYLDAQYLRNGIDLLGPAKAYVIAVNDDSLEIGLLWRVVDGLLEWKEAGKSLRDIETLPSVRWVTATGEPDYSTGANNDDYFFAKYESGLEGLFYPKVNAATHPAVSLWALFSMIFREAGIRWNAYIDGDNEPSRLYYSALLCDGHRPNKGMDLGSGSNTIGRGYVTSDNASLKFENWWHTWDRTLYTEFDGVRTEFVTTSAYDGKKKTAMYILLSLQNQTPGSYSLLGNSIQVVGRYVENFVYEETVLAEIPFEATEGSITEVCVADLELNVEDFNSLYLRYKTELPSDVYGNLIPYQGVGIRVAYVHDAIQISQQNSFPLAVNLPDMKQLDFVKGVCAMFGFAPFVTSSGMLRFVSYDEMLGTADAIDWTYKLSDISKVDLALSGQAKKNVIKYTEDETVRNVPDAVIVTEDETIQDSRDLYKLPFAASKDGIIKHYKVAIERDDSGNYIYTAEDVDIKPRVLKVVKKDEERYLTFPEDFKGEALVNTYYSRYQSTVRKPVVIEALVRLNELDLVGLDFTRSVYLAQTGRYYAIKSVQADDSDLCKVELIQIA